MKTLSFFGLGNLLVVTSLFAPVLAQGWMWQNPLPTGNPITAVDFVDSLNGWFASSAGSILHTSDGGESWEIQHTGVDAWFGSVDFVDSEYGWAAGQVLIPAPSGGVYGGGAIVHTKDGGEHWTVQLVDTLTSFDVITFVDRKHGWAAGQGDKIFRTTDGGLTWEGVEFEILGQPRALSIAFIDSLRGWAGGNSFTPFLFTKDGGRSWHVDTTVSSIGRLVCFADSLHGWVIGFFGKVWRTVDGGNSWTGGTDVIPGRFPLSAFFVDSLVGWVSMAEFQEELDEEGAYKTVDGGQTWEKVSSSTPESFFFFDAQSGWLGFTRTFDGGRTLAAQKHGFTFDRVTEVDYIDAQTGWVVGDGGLIAKSNNGGEDWQIQQSGVSSTLLGIHSFDEQRAWVVGAESAILNTADGGTTWRLRQLNPGSIQRYTTVMFVDSLNGWIVGSTILSTKDGGVTWREHGSGDVVGLLTDVVFINEIEGWVTAKSGGGGFIYHTTDSGETWNLQFQDLSRELNALFFLNQNTAWAAGSFLVLGTMDGGESWVEQKGGKRTVSEDIFFFDANTGLTCGVIGDILYTDDGGNTWQKQIRTTTNTLNAIDFVDERLGWIVGDKGTLLHTDIGGITSTETTSSSTNARNFHLYANYPNPFNSQTVITYELVKKGSIRLIIYDILGREVIRLIDKVQPAGFYDMIWNGKNQREVDVPSGLYFYSLRFENSQKTGKMILLR